MSLSMRMTELLAAQITPYLVIVCRIGSIAHGNKPVGDCRFWIPGVASEACWIDALSAFCVLASFVASDTMDMDDNIRVIPCLHCWNVSTW